MKTSNLDYYKLILEKVSFDTNLLNKEYKKSCKALTVKELKLLDLWLLDNKISLLIRKG